MVFVPGGEFSGPRSTLPGRGSDFVIVVFQTQPPRAMHIEM